jgi:hypothetical protein
MQLEAVSHRSSDTLLGVYTDVKEMCTGMKHGPALQTQTYLRLKFRRGFGCLDKDIPTLGALSGDVRGFGCRCLCH